MTTFGIAAEASRSLGSRRSVPPGCTVALHKPPFLKPSLLPLLFIPTFYTLLICSSYYISTRLQAILLYSFCTKTFQLNSPPSSSSTSPIINLARVTNMAPKAQNMVGKKPQLRRAPRPTEWELDIPEALKRYEKAASIPGSMVSEARSTQANRAARRFEVELDMSYKKPLKPVQFVSGGFLLSHRVDVPDPEAPAPLAAKEGSPTSSDDSDVVTYPGRLSNANDVNAEILDHSGKPSQTQNFSASASGAEEILAYIEEEATVVVRRFSTEIHSGKVSPPTSPDLGGVDLGTNSSTLGAAPSGSSANEVRAGEDSGEASDASEVAVDMDATTNDLSMASILAMRNLSLDDDAYSLDDSSTGSGSPSGPTAMYRRRQEEDIMDADIDEDLKHNMLESFRKDRLKKKELKLKRQQLRAQGLLGRKNKFKAPEVPEVPEADDYTYDSFIWAIQEDFRKCLASSSKHFIMYGLNGRELQFVDRLGLRLDVDVHATGRKANAKTVYLIKSDEALEYDEERFMSAVREVGMGFAKKVRSFGGSRASRNAAAGRAPHVFGGSKFAAASPKNGHIVGAKAKEISLDNKGRLMIEKLGWVPGTPLGRLGGNGILTPITSIVRTTKLGLGTGMDPTQS
ncbi:hypothetical protein EJ06DRAFT_36022 [Trichodelitschia bisporula]|uniref:G-patch domain-containing protein n=1 Tax=Trichodelitschia bisporula TaxID=703511 RepID=A0A6G1HVG2_9PEZI|nr:hypothetical protein EJ06DRAFT_36022 [Trichodelitschia bisporula]